VWYLVAPVFPDHFAMGFLTGPLNTLTDFSRRTKSIKQPSCWESGRRWAGPQTRGRGMAELGPPSMEHNSLGMRVNR
jgi:hypothetical protein